MIRLAFRTTLVALRDVWDEMFTLLLYNLLWTLSIVPIVTLPATTGALFYMTHKIAEGRVVGFEDFKRGFRVYFRQSSILGGLNLIVFLLLLANYSFYSHYPGLVFRLIQILYVYLFFVWLVTQLYIFPILLEQKTPSLRTAIRNAFVLILKHPLYSVLIGVMALVLVAVCVVLTLPAFLLMASILALLGNRAVLTLLEFHRGDEK